MRVMFQIEYERPPETQQERDEGYSEASLLPIETLSCCDPSLPEHRKMLHETLDELLDYIVFNPETARFWVGGECRTAHHGLTTL